MIEAAKVRYLTDITDAMALPAATAQSVVAACPKSVPRQTAKGDFVAAKTIVEIWERSPAFECEKSFLEPVPKAKCIIKEIIGSNSPHSASSVKLKAAKKAPLNRFPRVFASTLRSRSTTSVVSKRNWRTAS